MVSPRVIFSIYPAPEGQNGGANGDLRVWISPVKPTTDASLNSNLMWL
jgi:hypothetical protein